MSGSPIIMWNAGVTGAIIGIHTGGNGMQNFGTCFLDDKGLLDIFGQEELISFLNKCSQYQPKQRFGDAYY